MTLSQVRARPGSSSIAASCSVDTTVIVWDLTKVSTYLQYYLHNLQCLCVQKAEAAVLQRLEGHLGYVTSLLWVGGGGLLVSASWDHTVKVRVIMIPSPISYPLVQVWDTGRGKQLHSLDRHREPVTRYSLYFTDLYCRVLYCTVPSPGSRSPPTLATSSPAARTGRSTSGTSR